MRSCFFISLAAHASLLLLGYFANILTPESSEIEFEFADVSILDLDEWVAISTPAPMPVGTPKQLSRDDILDQPPPAPVAPVVEPPPPLPEIGRSPLISAASPAIPDFAAPSATLPPPPRVAPPEVVAPPPPPEPERDAEAEEPAEAAAPKVASEAALEPDPDAARDDEVQVATSPDPSAQSAATKEVEQSTAPEQAATRIVTEPEEAAESTALPIRRPSYVAVRAEPPSDSAADLREPEAAEAEQADIADDAEPRSTGSQPDNVNIDELIEQVQLEDDSVEGESPTEPILAFSDVGPALPSSVSEGLRDAIQDCWNLGALSTAGMRTVLTVGFSLNRNGTVKGETIKLVSAQSESEVAERRAFDAARRAIICGLSRKHDFPAESYARWQSIEMTFDPEQMRQR